MSSAAGTPGRLRGRKRLATPPTPGMGSTPGLSTPDGSNLGALREDLSNALEAVSQLEGGQQQLLAAQTQAMDLQLAALEALSLRIDAAQNHVTGELQSFKADVRELISRIETTRQAVTEADEQETRLRTIWYEKQFVPRNSMLTDMLAESEHYRTIYNIAVAVLILLFIQIGMTEWVEKGEWVSLDLFYWAFAPVGTTFPSWVALAALSFLIVPLVQAIVAWRLTWRAWLGPYIALHLALTALAAGICLTTQLSVPSALIVVVEQVRMSMKVHAYLREKLLYGRAREEVAAAVAHLTAEAGEGGKASLQAAASAAAAKESGPDMGGTEALPFPVKEGSAAFFALYVPRWARKRGLTLLHVAPPDIEVGDASTEIGRFLYFFFAPTLIYRDSYPRSRPGIDWVKALVHAAELLGVIGYCYVLLQTFVVPDFSNTPENPGDVKTFMHSVFRSMVPGMMVLFLLFFGVLHVFFNMFAVMLRHADRLFYENWWSTTNWSEYYRKWNMVVGEALRTYLYYDLQRFTRGRLGRGGALAAVFVISAFVHEWILAVAIGFWFPVLLFMFGGPGVYFMRLTRGSHSGFNVFMWTMLSVGTSLLLVLYSREWYARHATPPVLQGDEYGVLTPLMPYSLFAYYRNLVE